MNATIQRSAFPDFRWPSLYSRETPSVPFLPQQTDELDSPPGPLYKSPPSDSDSDHTITPCLDTLPLPSSNALLKPPVLPSQPLKFVKHVLQGHIRKSQSPRAKPRKAPDSPPDDHAKFTLASRRAVNPISIDLADCAPRSFLASTFQSFDTTTPTAWSDFPTPTPESIMSDSQRTPLAPKSSAPLAVPIAHPNGQSTAAAYDSASSGSVPKSSTLFSGLHPSDASAPSSYDSAHDAGGLNDQSALMQVLQGITEMRKELSRVHQRLDAIEGTADSLYSSSPNMRPHTLTRINSFRGIETPRSHSPDKGAVGLPPHITSLAGAVAQPAPILAKQPDLGLWCVVPAGGAGTRLWPLSRESYPKFLLDLTASGRTLIQSTWDRLLPLAGASQLMVVTGAAHVDPVMGQLPDLDQNNVFAEPSPKESMAAIGLAAAVLKRRDPDAVLGSFAADHIISGRDAFEAAVTEAVAVAKAGYLVTIGIAPSYPSTGFGYIKLGESLKVPEAPNARKVTEFKEKPDARTASAYLSTGNYRWNGGMFVVKAAVLMELLAKSMPALHDGLDKIAASWDTANRQSVLNEVWPTLDKIAIDHAVAEPAARLGKVAVVPATFGWDDVGDFSSLADLLPAEKGEARILGDSRMVITEGQAGGLIVPAGGRPVACLGVDDVVVVDTQHVLLVTTRARAQDVKKMVARVKARNWTHLT